MWQRKLNHQLGLRTLMVSFVLIVFLIGNMYSGFSCVVVQVVSPSLFAEAAVEIAAAELPSSCRVIFCCFSSFLFRASSSL